MTPSRKDLVAGGTVAPASSHQWQVDTRKRRTSLASDVSEQLRITLERAEDLIDFGSVQVDGRLEQDPKRRLAGTETVTVNLPMGGTRRFYEADPARILYRDAHLLADDKEAGIPRQQTPHDAYNNLVAALYRLLSRTGGRQAPYLAMHHRLDRDTSGVMVFCLDRSANRRLGEAFQRRQVEKDYLAWVEGNPREDSWTAAEDIGRKDGRYVTRPAGEGKSARTFFRVLCRESGRSLVHARPITGRTHQIRLHLAHAGHPVIGDRRYGGRSADRLMLHACRLVMPHPVTGSRLTLTASPPDGWPSLPETASPG